MTIEISAFAWVPPFAQGYVKDMRVRWALAEAGLPYNVRALADGDGNSADYRAWQPFGQVPAFRDDDVILFESGAILLHIARKAEALAPRDAQEAAQTEAWVFAALNSIEPKIDNLILPPIFYAGEAWVDGWRPHAERLVRLRLTSLSNALGTREWLTGRFGVADIVMATVLRGLEEDPILAEFPNLAAYLKRCLARPSFATALAAQMETFRQHEPA
ncbi:glutathione S-transferase family protein [Acuticoccus kandeliae]|uniref:glutathione S-transferase family protein n=1 Tax=Acuticoccus kandeliae TaxID=2073160 RepID=UPI000D3E4715|nr:glutathione S-transferase family protein [Acuticoccus kandeliae]